MFAEFTKTSKGECLLNVLKVVKVNILFECTKTTKDECLPITLKLVKMNVC